MGETKNIGSDSSTWVLETLSLSEIQRQIETNLESENYHWDDFWTNLIATTLGCPGCSLQEINQQLSQKAIPLY